MASSDNLEEPYSLLVEVLADPGRGKERLPRIVGLFESDDRRERLCAAWACSVVANELEDDDTIAYLVRRLSDRLDDEYVSLELTTTLDYVSTRYPEQVERILDELDEEKRERGEIPLPQVGNFTRSNYYNNDPTRDGVGRTHIAGENAVEDPRNAYADTQREEREREEHERDRERDDSGKESDTTDDGETAEAEADEEAFGAMGRERTEVTSIATRSRFDKLHILAARQRERYADIYDALVGRGSEEKAIALRLFHEPEGNADLMDYRGRMETQLRRWRAVSDHPHITAVLEWDTQPRPWAATLFAGESLAEYGRVPSDRALEDAINLADAVGYLHRNGVIHAGIDPGNVVYPGELMGDDGKQLPLLDNIGLMHVVRFHFEPSLHLDPRYAAPEYFDRQYGTIDHATDIYQLGAVLYHLFTGEPPYAGEFDQVRGQVLDEDPPDSVDVDDIPPAAGEVIRKAMSKQKLTRYETVEHLQQELAGVQNDG